MVFVALLGIIVAGGHAAFERIGTDANADTIEFITNYAGGFLAIGFTDDQPGFVVLSQLGNDDVDISAEFTRSLIGGTRTIVQISTARDRRRIRLRKPQVIVINEEGAIELYEVGWTYAQFQRIRAATDCSHPNAEGKRRCGAPFADLCDAVSAGRLTSVPESVQAFLARFAAKSTRAHAF